MYIVVIHGLNHYGNESLNFLQVFLVDSLTACFMSYSATEDIVVFVY